MLEPNFHWDDFRYFLAVAAAGSVRNAAVMLKVNPSTVTRRLEALEKELGVFLFRRSVRGLTLTAEGADVVERVRQISDQLAHVKAELMSNNTHVEGPVNLAMPLFLAPIVLPELAKFRVECPGIELNFLRSPLGVQALDGTADLLISATDHPPESKVGHRLGQIAMAAYASKAYIKDRDRIHLETAGSWIDLVGTGEFVLCVARLRDDYFPEIKVGLRCEEIEYQHACIKAGLGIGILPCYLAEPDQTLHRIPDMPISMSPMLWLLSHPDLRRLLRVQVASEFIRAVFVQHVHRVKGSLLQTKS